MSQTVTPINTPNKTSNFYPANPDQWLLTELAIVASVAMEQGMAVCPQITSNTTTGNYTKMAVENALWSNFAGILAETITSTDSDYTTAWKKKAVWIPKSSLAKSYFAVWAGTFTLADVGKTVEFHSDSKSLAVDTAGKWAVITDFISSTRWICQFSLPVSETA